MMNPIDFSASKTDGRPGSSGCYCGCGCVCIPYYTFAAANMAVHMGVGFAESLDIHIQG